MSAPIPAAGIPAKSKFVNDVAGEGEIFTIAFF